MISETEAEIRKADQEMRQKADAEIASQVSNLEKAFMSDVKKMKNKASKNVDEAVSYTINRILKTEV